MARIETDPNYSSPTFSRATAATDLFKKEDVQGVAAALSTHTHGSGLGLPIAASAIPNGSITSAMIADGTIVSGDMALNSVSVRRFAYGLSASPSTTSTSFVAIPDLSSTFTVAEAGSDILVWVALSVYNTVVGAFQSVSVQLDAGGDTSVSTTVSTATGGNGMSVLSALSAFALVSAGSHTITARWRTLSGSMTSDATQRYMTILELKR